MTVQSPDDAETIGLALARTRMFGGWPDDVMARICAASEVRRYRKGTALARQGDPPQGMWLVVEGCLCTHRSWSDGRRFIYENLLPGQATGILPTLDGNPVALDVTAQENTVAVFIPCAAMREALSGSPERLMQMVQLLCRRARVDYETMLSKAIDSPRVQLIKIILYLARGAQVPGAEGYTVPVDISQDDIADMTGVSRQTVSKELAPLIRAGLLDWKYRRIRIVDAQGLIDLVQKERPLAPEMLEAVFGRPNNIFSKAD